MLLEPMSKGIFQCGGVARQLREETKQALLVRALRSKFLPFCSSLVTQDSSRFSNPVRRAHAAGRLRSAGIVSDNSTLAQKDSQPTSLRSSAFRVLDPGRTALEDNGFVRGGILCPVP